MKDYNTKRNELPNYFNGTIHSNFGLRITILHHPFFNLYRLEAGREYRVFACKDGASNNAVIIHGWPLKDFTRLIRPVKQVSFEGSRFCFFTTFTSVSKNREHIDFTP
jgi:hypothetical protein